MGRTWVGAAATVLAVCGSALVGSLVPASVAGAAQPPTASASPSAGLLDGQPVTVSGSGFDAGASVAIIECETSATSEAGCDPSTLQFTGAGPSGAFSTTYRVSRLISVATGGLDCAQPGACELGVANTANFAQATSIAISFLNVPIIPPTMSAFPATNLADGQTIIVSGSNFGANAGVGVAECAAGATSQTACDLGTVQFAQTTSSGAFTTFPRMTRVISVGSGTIDCAQPNACELGAANVARPTRFATVPISFRDLPILPPNVTVLPSTRLLTGQALTILGSRFSPGATVAMVECEPGATNANGCDLSTVQYATVASGGSFSALYHATRMITIGGFGPGPVPPPPGPETTPTPLDCAQPNACVLGVGNLANHSQGASVPISFQQVPVVPPSVLVLPSSGLRDGQPVTVLGSSYNPGAGVAMIECRTGATISGGCDYSTLQFVTSNPVGGFSTTYRVTRFISVTSGTPGAGPPTTTTVDCAGADACFIGTAGGASFSQSTATPIAFLDLPVAPPALTALPAANLVNGQSIIASGSGFRPGGQVGIAECAAGASTEEQCDISTVATASVDSSGSFATIVRVKATLATFSGTVDCTAPGRCALAAANIANFSQSASTPITFRAGGATS